MATQTTHYSLVKPAYEDQADVGVLNGDLDQIDELIYDANNDVRPVSKGGTGAATAAEARTNLGLGDVLDDVDDIKNSLDGTKFITKYMPANGSVSYTFTSNCAFAVLISGSTANVRSIILGYCTSSGSISYSKMDAASSNAFTIETSSHLLTFKSTASYSIYLTFIKMVGTAPT